jgi:type VI secretion system secreted protein VgrG
MAAPTQAHRGIAIGTPLGDDVLLFRSMQGSERLSRPFCYEVDLWSEQADINADDIVGQNVTVRIATADSGTRYINGMVRAFSKRRSTGRLNAYHATIVPALWMLTRTSDCKIYQNMTVPDIIMEVLGDHGVTDYDNRLTATYREWENCVQYRETDFNFISRLMEQEGIHYYFEHEDGRHVMVLADGSTAYSDFEGYATISYRPPDQASTAGEHVRRWWSKTEVQPGSYVLDDFDPKNPSLELQASAQIQSGHIGGDFEMFDAPGEYVAFSEGQTYSQIRLEEFHAEHQVAGGDADARGIVPGCTFELADHPNSAENGRYLVTSATISARSDEFSSGVEEGGEPAGTAFSCSFTVIGADTQFRPKRITPKPLIRGPQTAIVTGPAGEEIYTDQYGRVKVQFHWDRHGQADENSSCWIRVAQLWAGKKWGAMYIPRIGQEVVVEYLEGDPDRPIITGRVYNGAAMPPYDLPTDKTKSTIKSNSTIGGGGMNEFMFEDKKGQELVFLRAEKDMDTLVQNDSKEEVQANRHLVVGGSQYEQVGVDKHLKVKGNQNEEIGGNYSRKVTLKSNEDMGISYALKAKKIDIKADLCVNIEAPFINIKGEICSVAGGATLTLKGGIVLINSGGGASSAKAASPEAPEAPASPQQGQLGQVSAAAMAPQPPTPKTYSSSAQAPQQAAASGSPATDSTSPSDTQSPQDADPNPPAPTTQSPEESGTDSQSEQAPTGDTQETPAEPGGETSGGEGGGSQTPGGGGTPGATPSTQPPPATDPNEGTQVDEGGSTTEGGQTAQSPSGGSQAPPSDDGGSQTSGGGGAPGATPSTQPPPATDPNEGTQVDGGGGMTIGSDSEDEGEEVVATEEEDDDDSGDDSQSEDQDDEGGEDDSDDDSGGKGGSAHDDEDDGEWEEEEVQP